MFKNILPLKISNNKKLLFGYIILSDCSQKYICDIYFYIDKKSTEIKMSSPIIDDKYIQGQYQKRFFYFYVMDLIDRCYPQIVTRPKVIG